MIKFFCDNCESELTDRGAVRGEVDVTMTQYIYTVTFEVDEDLDLCPTCTDTFRRRLIGSIDAGFMREETHG